jgi:hypothetical protein
MQLEHLGEDGAYDRDAAAKDPRIGTDDATELEGGPFSGSSTIEATETLFCRLRIGMDEHLL